MKHLLLTIIGFVPLLLLAQDWTKNLPTKRDGEKLKLTDYQNAFNEYCKENNVQRGYMMVDGEKVKMSGYKQFKRWEWYWETQVDLNGNFPEKTALQVAREFELNNKRTNRAQYSGDWKSIGPNSSDGGYAGVGRINFIAFHPTDVNTYWVGTPAGGLWVTRDHGNSWTVLTEMNTVLGVSSIIIPSDYETSKTIYIGTGDRDAWDNNSIGVLKSTDDGKTWNVTGLEYNVSSNEMVYSMLLDPNDNNTIIAATSNGVFKTSDGGTTWTTKLASYEFIDMEYKPGNFEVLYGSTKNGQIYRSINAGQTWNLVQSTSARTELAVTPANPEYVYAISAASNNGLYGIYQSINSGETFTKVFNGTTYGNNLLGWGSGSDTGGQGWYDLCIAASPKDEKILLVGGINTWQSKDGGKTWSLVSHWYGGFGKQAVHADKHFLRYRSNGDLFECNDGGVYVSAYDGNSNTWMDKTNGIVHSQIYKLSVAQQKEDEVIVGLQDNGSKLKNGANWSDVKGGDGMECLIDYSNIKIQYATYVEGQIDKTTNHWDTQSDISPADAGNGAWVTPYIIDPVNPAILYAGYSNVYKTINRGSSWTKISSMNSSNKIREMAICHSNNKVIWVTDQYSVWKTIDGGTNWTKVSIGMGTQMTYIAIKADNPDVVWITGAGYGSKKVFRTENGGSTWTDISAGLPSIPVNTIAQDTTILNMEVIYVGTDAGVYQKIGDKDFVKFSAGMPDVKVAEIEIYYDDNKSNNKLRAATYGRGLWETPIGAAFESPVAAIDADYKSVKEGSVVKFTDKSENYPSVRRWYFPGGTPEFSTDESPLVTYATKGLYNVAIFVSNDLGNDSIMLNGYISVYGADFVPPIELKATTVKTSVSLSWTSPEGSPIAIEEGFENNFPPAGWEVKYSATADGSLVAPTSDQRWGHCDENTFGDQPSPEYIHTGKYSAAIGYTAPEFNWLITNTFMAKSDYELRFWMWYTNDVAKSWITKLHIKVFADGSWSTIKSYGAEDPTNIYQTEQVMSLAAYGGKNIRLAFVYESNDGYEVAIDDIYVGVAKGVAGVNFVNRKINSERKKFNVQNYTEHLSRGGSSYKVFRNNELIGTVDNFLTTTYVDNNLTPGTYNYHVVAVYVDPAGESSESNHVTTIIHAAPKAEFSVSAVSGDGPLTVNFINESTEADSYMWFFGDGATSDEKDPIHVYNTGGVFTVTLVAVNQYYTDTIVKENLITVTYPEVTADFSADPLTGEYPVKVQFTNLSKNATNYTWYFGNGSTSGYETPSYTYTRAGEYDVELRAWNNGSSDTLIKKAYIKITAPAVKADFTADVKSGAAPLVVQFTNASTGSSKYAWDFGDGTTSTSQNPSHTYKTVGNYTVKLVASNYDNSDEEVKADFITVITGIDDNTTINSVRIYPNPAEDYFNVEFNNFRSEGSVIEILGISGNVISTITVTESGVNEKKIMLDGVNTGSYFVKISNGNAVKILKLNKF